MSSTDVARYESSSSIRGWGLPNIILLNSRNAHLKVTVKI